METIVQILKDFRFSEYEIKVLLALLRNGELTASEIAEKSGIPRTSVYEVVNNLETRGFVESFGKPKRFRTIPANRLVELLSSRLSERIKMLEKALKEIEMHTGKEIVEFYRGEMAYSVIDKIISESSSAEVYALSLSRELELIFSKWHERVRLNLMGKSDVVHGLVFAGNLVLIFTEVRNNLNVMIGSGEFCEFYREMVNMFKNKNAPGI